MPEIPGTQQYDELSVLESADKNLIESPDRNETPELPGQNILNRISDKCKDGIGVIYPPYKEKRNEQKCEAREREKAEKYAISIDKAKGIQPENVSKTVSKPTPSAHVIEDSVFKDSKKNTLEDIDGNSKLWIGKDYANFIVKDFTKLNQPFVGEECFKY